MRKINWGRYSEEELQVVIEYLFLLRGYDVFNLHLSDRRGEEGIDLECTKRGETEKIVIAVKVEPQKGDILQLEQLSKRSERTKIYIYADDPSATFKKAMEKYKGVVSFWNGQKLTDELFDTDAIMYTSLIIEESFRQDMYAIGKLMMKSYSEGEKSTKEQETMSDDIEKIGILWAAKDKSVSVNRSMMTLQLFLEGLECLELRQSDHGLIVSSFLARVESSYASNLSGINTILQEFVKKNPVLIKRFCVETKGRSIWAHLQSRQESHFKPGKLIVSFSEDLESARKWTNSDDQYLLRGLANIAKVLSIDGYWVEAIIDILHSIIVFGRWDYHYLYQ